ncbi:hypothetical protein [Paracraurococcus lichenis]|uniref:Uncharacterized protein n=1 Tax=Paracraurococcus lichenis TaxID=3064888 RepID=A0ABT9DW48_9PROT|nr:hypothetical protein [Paracraurococcus sp. LOR1-02]MDO9708119.1 hypothetical protein [Paracraurococcus sp. LOR1-02]
MRDRGSLITRQNLGGLVPGGLAALAPSASAQDGALRLGLRLPFSGTCAALGENIAATVDLHLAAR